MRPNMKNAKKVWPFLLRDPVLFAAAVAALVSAVFVPPSMAYYTYLDLRVISLLLSLMLVVAGLEKAGLFNLLTAQLLKRVHTTSRLAFILVGLCFFCSMFITNDVALITFVPLGIMLLTQTHNQKLLIPVIVLQTLAANLGSMLTPLGNPQNLYLYALSNMTIWQFLRIMWFPTALSLLLLAAALFLIKPESVTALPEPRNKNIRFSKMIPFVFLFLLCLLSVLHLLSYVVTLAAVLAGVLILDRTILFRADYGLLLTFVFLFILIGNIKSLPAVSNVLSSIVCGQELTAGILLSQGISNVPAAMLLSKFTENYQRLLLGVNLGGLGTMIASMASLISYKLYARTIHAQKRKYFAVFTAVNILFLTVLWYMVQ